MDLSDTIAPNSDQLDAVDLLSGPRTFSIQRVSKGNAEQPVNVHLAEFPRPWRPGKSMRRVLVAAWGPDASTYVGRRVTLWCDPQVMFGGAAVGGTRITHLSHLTKTITVPLLVTRGKSAMYTVKPLSDQIAPTPPVTSDTLDILLGLFATKGIAEHQQLPGVNHITGGAATDLAAITEREAQQVIDALRQRPDLKSRPAEGAGEAPPPAVDAEPPSSVPQGGEVESPASPPAPDSDHARELRAQAAASWGDQ